MATTGTRLVWDKAGEHFYETGTDHGVLYPQENGAYPLGVVWNGLTAVTEAPTGAEANPLYADNIKYLNLMSVEEFAATIEAYTYPDEFAACNGELEIAGGVRIGQQPRKTFGMSYRTILGNDTLSNNYGYQLHLIYGALAAPSEKAYATVNDSPEAVTFSWEISTTPVTVTGFQPTASLTIDSTKVNPEKLTALETVLYGTDPTVTASQPDDWTTNYADYLMDDGAGGWKNVEAVAEAAPTWEANKYYKAGEAARLPLPDEVAQIIGTDEANF